ncbi:MAG: hypothetical protein FIA96_13760 [Betaproteobacteria bacterium]|nr:hypothetical protein [Betaproteobacteria bacterium]
MKKSFSIFAILVTLTATASAQQSAESIQTSGTGELSKQSDLANYVGSVNASIRLPATVSAGDVIPVQYQTAAGGAVSDSFMVTGITISGDRCSLQSKRRDSQLIDTISTQPCSRLK